MDTCPPVPHRIPRCDGLQSYAERWGQRVALGGEHLAYGVSRSGGGGAGTHVLQQAAKMGAVRLTQTGHHVVALGFVHGCRPSVMNAYSVDSDRVRRKVPYPRAYRHSGGRMEEPRRDVKRHPMGENEEKLGLFPS